MTEPSQFASSKDRVGERDLVGYGQHPPKIRWPGGAGLAVNFVLNVEEGSEYTLADGDGASEGSLTEIRAPRVPVGNRDLAAESMYEYGSRVGFWRLYRLFRERGLPLTIFACAQALERNSAIAAAISETDWDICAHGWRWVEHYKLDPAAEREHIAKAFNSIRSTIGRAPVGWYCRYAPSEVTRELVVEHGGFEYDSDAYNDEVPYWLSVKGKPHLVIPYALSTNDSKMLAGDVYCSEDYATFLRDSIDVLSAESGEHARMLTIGMHARVLGHPGRVAGLMRLLDELKDRKDIWICRRADIAAHWRAEMPFDAAGAAR